MHFDLAESELPKDTVGMCIISAIFKNYLDLYPFNNISHIYIFFKFIKIVRTYSMHNLKHCKKINIFILSIQ